MPITREDLDYAERIARNWWNHGTGTLHALGDVDDAIQEAWIATVAARSTWNSEQGVPFGAYQNVKVRFHLTDWYRRTYGRRENNRAQRKPFFLTCQLDEDWHAPAADHIEDVETEELIDTIAGDDDRLRHILRSIRDGDRYEDIGERLGITASRVTQVCHAARARAAAAGLVPTRQA